MNYIFYYTGKIPKHVFYSLNSINNCEKDSKIFFCSDSELKFHNTVSQRVDELQSSTIRAIDDLFNENSKLSLWKSSMLRIFYILEVAKKNNIEKFVHFDSDVLLFKSYSEVEKSFDQNKFNITPLNEKNLVFGYSYVANLNVYENICNHIFEILRNKKEYENEYLDGKTITEMSALGIVNKIYPDLFNLLPVLPRQEYNFVFDPGSYGQYLGGVDKKYFSKGYVSENHIIGRKIIKDKIKPTFSKTEGPAVHNKEQKYELVNLHIHKKNLKKFLIKSD
tara:strand:+ start:27016 stop:27852 length:837 start_codon:yes stop_codon:yes gene_type:complete